MKRSLLFCGLLAGLCGALLVTAQDYDEDEGRILVDNKCKCVRVTSRLVPSPDNPDEKIVERNIRLIVPLKNRENISDPTSPVRTTFVYRLSELCNKCDPVEVEVGNEVVLATQSNRCDEENETCYTYDRNKCYTSTASLYLGGETRTVTTALTPESCYSD
ncbi:immunoglobulin J chain [Trichosurus vulpecula]|uniref:immunoglobulin J chain n=1 Tax=Trichosurus vulpecula TaxID=9337 RepID=UPI000011C4F0|nr:immunoglobulin J chain [Trichosurus vulpecula]AAD41689.1 immunoglobulin J chain [Trichosurus vulpecula]